MTCRMLCAPFRAPFVFLLAVCTVRGAALPPGEGDPNTVSDTSRVYPLGEVVVTGSRFPSLAASLPSSVTSLSSSEFRQRPGGLVADDLAGVPGLVLTTYGGLGSVQTAAIRGMSSEHTLVLIDGQRLNSYENSTADLGMLSTLGVGRIEVARGGTSALYGSDAIGGVINIIPERPSRELSAGVHASLGSNDYSSIEVLAGGGTGPVSGGVGLRRERGRGDFEYRFFDGASTTRLKRSDGDFSILSSNARIVADISSSVQASVLALFSDADRGSPGPVTDATSQAQSRLHDRLLRLQTGLKWIAGSGLSASLSSSWTSSTETYNDPLVLLGGTPLSSYYDNHAFSLTPEIRYDVAPDVAAAAGIELAHGSLASSDVSSVQRWQHSPFVSTQLRVAPGSPFLSEILIFPSIRYDGFSDVKGDISPKLGLNASILSDRRLRIRASYGKSVRIPTFNQLYWLAGGNPRLHPERSLSFDAGIVSETDLGGSLTLEATYFSIDTRERIAWIPQSGGYWSPKNIARVASSGLEAEVRWFGFDHILGLMVNSTWTTARKESEDFPGDPTAGKELIYVPRQVVNGTATVTLDSWTLFLEYTWTSFRYTTETNDRFLPSYGVTSAALRYSFPIGGTTGFVKVEGTNLFNASYQVIALYPMPLRQLRFTVGGDL